MTQLKDDALSRLFVAFTERPDDENRRTELMAAIEDPAAEMHWVKTAAESWLSADPPDTDVVLIRFRTELLRLEAAVTLQLGRIPVGDAGRVGELLIQRVGESEVDAAQVEADLHFFLVAAAALFACARAACDLLDIDQPGEPSNLRVARNISQHIDEYNAGKGRDRSVWRQRVQTWQLRNEGGRAVWTWIEIDVQTIAKQAMELACRIRDDINSRVPSEVTGDYLLISEPSEGDVD